MERSVSDPFGAPKPDPDQLVRVAVARHQTEAEFFQSMLEEAGIRVLIKRSPGFDVPDYLAAGGRDLFVRISDEADARAILRELAGVEPGEVTGPNPVYLLAGLLLAVGVVALVLLLGFG